MVAHGISDEELEGLSEEERAALGVDDDDADALKGVVDEAGNGAGDGDDDNDNDNDAGDGGGDGADAESGGGKGAAGKADAAGDDVAGGADDAGTGAGDGDEGSGDGSQEAGSDRLVTRYHAEAPENYEQQVQEINTALVEARRAWRAGDLSEDDLAAKEAELTERRLALEAQKVKAEIAAETTQQQAAQEWDFEVRSFMREVTRTEGIDYKDAKNKALNDDLDLVVKMLGNDPKNNDKSGEWFLQEGHRIVKAKHNLGGAGAGDGDGKGGKGAEGKPGKPVERRANTEKLPKTLGGLPAAGVTETGNDGEFSHLDKLDGMELEQAIARLTPDQADRYARAA